jgi:hypothetical protein
MFAFSHKVSAAVPHPPFILFTFMFFVAMTW